MILSTSFFGKAKLKIQVLQQEAYPAIWPPVYDQNLAIPGAIPQNGRKPVRNVAELPCKISRRSKGIINVDYRAHTTYGGMTINFSRDHKR